MDREIPEQTLRKEKLSRIFKIVLIPITILLALMMFRNLLFPKIKSSDILTAVTEIGTIEGTVTASGIVKPEFEKIISSPIQSKIESVKFNTGDKIIPDSSIIELDTETLESEVKKLTDELQLKRNQRTKLSVDMEKRLIDLNTSYDIQQLRLKSLKASVDIKQQLYEIGAATKRELEQAELNRDIASSQLKQIEQQIQNEQKSQEIDLSNLVLQIEIQQTEINSMSRKLHQAKITSSTPGVITWINNNIGVNVTAGEPLVKIADLNSFKIEAKISDMHADKLIIGNPVRIRIGNNDLRGNISAIEPTSENGVITFTLELNDKTNRLLRSNLRVDIYVITSFKENVVRVKSGPFNNGAGNQEIFVIKDGEAQRRSAVIGDSNFDWVEIKNGVTAGEIIIISDMEDYIHKDRLKIK